jgi:hypothetical protein
MNKLKFFQSAFIVMLLINAALAVIIFLRIFDEKKPPDPKHYIIEKLHFSDKQIVEYERLIKNHQNKIKRLDKALRKNKTELYLVLKADNYDKKDSLISNIVSLQTDIEKVHFNHFLEIKKLCNKEQIPYFKELTHDLAKLFAPHPKKKKKPGKRQGE